MAARPNILVLMTDEERAAPPYEDAAMAAYRRTHLPARRRLLDGGVELSHHYVGATACTPSRATLFTGQYPSLHGVTNTDGMAKSADDPAMRWLDPDSVPTMGDWFRAIGYQTHYRGKWHISHADILIPGSHTSLASSDASGASLADAADAYRRADRLEPFGFSGWVGREPHGADPSDMGLVRDPVFAAQVDELFAQLEADPSGAPWLAVASFVNPHDIAFVGPLWDALGPPVADHVPPIPAAPSQADGFDDRPRCQRAFRDLWPKLLVDLPLDEGYRRLYAWLHELVDASILAVLDRLDRSGMADDTIVLFTSDHGDLVGAHGGLQQKWCNAYDEAIRVPFVVRGPGIAAGREPITIPTSHADVLPTLLGLVDADTTAALETVREHHWEARPLVGRDLSGVLRGTEPPGVTDGPVYFMTEDRITSGLRQTTLLTNQPFTPIAGAASVEAVITRLPTGADGATELWKLVHYYETTPDEPAPDDPTDLRWELHDLTHDPEERSNLAVRGPTDDRIARALATLRGQLEEVRAARRLEPLIRNPAPA